MQNQTLSIGEGGSRFVSRRHTIAVELLLSYEKCDRIWRLMTLLSWI
jgi:hypothetical protein